MGRGPEEVVSCIGFAGVSLASLCVSIGCGASEVPFFAYGLRESGEVLNQNKGEHTHAATR
ncbi:MAG: hypothetical protein K9I93_08975 [Chlorobium sp.]|nr:hypothetical protein [Chlorobium sp.]